MSAVFLDQPGAVFLDKPRAVFLDKDGTLIDNVPYNVDPAAVRLTPNAGPALRMLQDQGYRLIMVSNQSGVAHGRFSERALAPVWRKIDELLIEYGVVLHGFYYCPHNVDGSVSRYAVPCACRKPMPGMLRAAAREHGIDLGRSWMVGEILDDIEAGHRAGCRTVFIDNGNETEWHLTPQRTPHMAAATLFQAARMISAADQALRPVSYTTVSP